MLSYHTYLHIPSLMGLFLMPLLVIQCNHQKSDDGDLKKIRYVDGSQSFDPGELEAMCDSRATSKSYADVYRQRFHYYLTEQFSMRTLVRHNPYQSEFQDNPLDFDHADITITPESDKEREAIPDSCISSHNLGGLVSDWISGDYKFDYRKPVLSAIDKFNSESIYDITFPSQFTMMGAASCKHEGLKRVGRDWIAEEKNSLKRHLDTLCSNPENVISSFALNATLAYSFYKEIQQHPERSDLGTEEDFKNGFCSLTALVASDREKAQNWQENIEPWLIAGVGVTAGLATAPLTAATGGASSTAINVAMSAASVGRSFIRLIPLYNMLSQVESLEEDLKISSGESCSTIKEDIDRLWKLAFQDLVFEVGGFVVGMILPSAGKAALQAAAKSGVLRVTTQNIEQAGAKELVLAFKGATIPLHINSLKTVIEDASKNLPPGIAQKIANGLKNHLDQFVENVDRASLAGKAVNIDGKVIANADNVIDDAISSVAHSISAPCSLSLTGRCINISAFTKNMQVGDSFSVTSLKGNNYQGTFLGEDATYVYFRSPKSEDLAMLKAKLKNATFKVTVAERELINQKVIFKSVRGNLHEGVIIGDSGGELIDFLERNGRRVQLNRSQLASKERVVFFKDEHITIKYNNSNATLSGLFDSQSANGIVIKTKDRGLIEVPNEWLDFGTATSANSVRSLSFLDQAGASISDIRTWRINEVPYGHPGDVFTLGSSSAQRSISSLSQLPTKERYLWVLDSEGVMKIAKEACSPPSVCPQNRSIIKHGDLVPADLLRDEIVYINGYAQKASAIVDFQGASVIRGGKRGALRAGGEIKFVNGKAVINFDSSATFNRVDNRHLGCLELKAVIAFLIESGLRNDFSIDYSKAREGSCP